jgi:Domain of unknown function (DUF1772)
MLPALQVVTIVLAAIGMGLSLAHALELPGKLRLGKDAYLTVQTIYYPGFTIGGMFGEAGAILATFALVLLTPQGTPAFWLTLAALACLLIEHALYWIVTHPLNKAWLAGEKLQGAGATFFAAGRDSQSDRSWTELRDRWEYSHVARTVFAALSFIALVVAATMPA